MNPAASPRTAPQDRRLQGATRAGHRGAVFLFPGWSLASLALVTAGVCLNLALDASPTAQPVAAQPLAVPAVTQAEALPVADDFAAKSAARMQELEPGASVAAYGS